MSSTFSSLILSNLLQNPNTHAATSFAACFWPSPNMESSMSSHAGNNNGGFPQQPMNPRSSMATITAATVAAATAWWAAHGLLPLCAPLHNGFSCPSNGATGLITNVAKTRTATEEKAENNFQNHASSKDQRPNKELSEALSDSGNISGAKIDTNVVDKNIGKKDHAVLSEQKEPSNKGKSKKQVDRSSCGSNTPSGSDTETDALEKNNKGYEPKEPDVIHPASEPNCCHSRIGGVTNESWKEVSGEGRLAFQALFSKQVLPHSFSPPHDIAPNEQEMKNGDEGNRPIAKGSNETTSQLELNNTTWETCSIDQVMEKVRLLGDEQQDRLLTIGLSQGKLKASIMDSDGQDQENCAKRLRMDGEAST